MLRVRGSKPIVFLLAVLLLLTQQIGHAHALSHFAHPAGHPARSDTQHPAEKACVQCAIYAQLGSMLPAAGLSVPVPGADHELAADAADQSHFAAYTPPFLSRGPPRQST